MPAIFIHSMAQLATRYQQLTALDFTFGLGLDVKDLSPDPDNKVDNETRSITIKGVTIHINEQ